MNIMQDFMVKQSSMQVPDSQGLSPGVKINGATPKESQKGSRAVTPKTKGDRTESPEVYTISLNQVVRTSNESPTPKI